MRGVPGASRTLLYEDALAIGEQVVGISGFSAEQSPAPQLIKANGVTLESIAVVGTSSDFPNVRDYPVGEGTYFSSDDDDRKLKVAVLGSGLASDLFGSESALGQTITVGSTKLTVIGVMSSKGIVADVDYDGRIYIPINVVFQKYMTTSIMNPDSVRTVYVKVESKEKIDSVVTQITNLLATRHEVDPAKPNFTIQTQQDVIATQQATTAAFRNLLAWVAAISLLVGGIGIMNIMLVSVTERTREIGLRIALGAHPSYVQTQFLFESIILSLVGGLAGVLIGVVASILFGAFGEMRTEIVPLSIPLAFSAAAAIGIFFGYYPARQAAKLDPIVALRHE